VNIAGGTEVLVAWFRKAIRLYAAVGKSKWYDTAVSGI
jgi:hypothetical protein